MTLKHVYKSINQTSFRFDFSTSKFAFFELNIVFLIKYFEYGLCGFMFLINKCIFCMIGVCSQHIFTLKWWCCWVKLRSRTKIAWFWGKLFLIYWFLGICLWVVGWFCSLFGLLDKWKQKIFGMLRIFFRKLCVVASFCNIFCCLVLWLYKLRLTSIELGHI